MAFITLASAGCSPQTGNHGRLALDPTMEWRGERLVIVTGLEFEPGDAMREALARGVALEIQVVVRRSRSFGPLRLPAGNEVHSFRIQSLPLTRQWQLLSDSGTARHARLWLLLDALAEPRDITTGIERTDLDAAHWHVEVQARFNRAALPSPMRLPTLLSSQWRLTSRKHQWPIEPL